MEELNICDKNIRKLKKEKHLMVYSEQNFISVSPVINPAAFIDDRTHISVFFNIPVQMVEVATHLP